jgi:hypothetical protein
VLKKASSSRPAEPELWWVQVHLCVAVSTVAIQTDVSAKVSQSNSRYTDKQTKAYIIQFLGDSPTSWMLARWEISAIAFSIHKTYPKRHQDYLSDRRLFHGYVPVQVRIFIHPSNYVCTYKKRTLTQIILDRPSIMYVRHTQDISSPLWCNGNGTENKRRFQIVILYDWLAFTCAEEGAKRNGKHI